MHVAVTIKIKKILAMKVTDEHVRDVKVLPELIHDVIKSDKKIAIDKLFADEVYDGNNIFKNLIVLE